MAGGPLVLLLLAWPLTAWDLGRPCAGDRDCSRGDANLRCFGRPGLRQCACRHGPALQSTKRADSAVWLQAPVAAQGRDMQGTQWGGEYCTSLGFLNLHMEIRF
jgi:hypothetical protein